ncbi:MAG: zinc-binding alcohol dehydrogenase family protein [Oceanospirillaceae bacterium]|nr:zinc-binding alcohol dehydrogenase family protein [Oceanospirillaceae bacterium]MCP5335846.1 zinc-binding alcohol dehydrogenase family protein [Oceanospirillaceae bacterium]MCP5349632.1 zinc-binding alcohol dehydrogenase family protein [Oceanospirillaceae bacterium]
MHAALVTDYTKSPVFTLCSEPQPAPGEVLVHVTAAAKSQLVMAQASGKHYASPKPPFIPGVDGVGKLENGQRVYFAFPRAPQGAMAQRVTVPQNYTVVLPDDVDDISAAAMANPGMSSWAALNERAHFKSGEAVLIHGASGASGRLAIQIARYLGASRIVATARSAHHATDLIALGADAFIDLNQNPATLNALYQREFAAGLGIVLDFVWGPSAAIILQAAAPHAEGAAAPRIRYVNIGSMGGAEISLPASVLRSSGLELMGSGLGSVAHVDLVRCIGEMLRARQAGGFKIAATARPLNEVEKHWAVATPERMVFTL